MKKKLLCALPLIGLLALLPAVLGPAVTTGQPAPSHVLYDAAIGKLKPPTIPVTVPAGAQAPTGPGGQIPRTKTVPWFSSGVLASVQDALAASGGSGSSAAPRGAPAPAAPASSGADNLTEQSRGTLGCGQRNDGAGARNVRVNQDCTFRRQAEESIVFNPADPTNLLAGMNDSRVGFNQCGIAWSTDNGRHWGDLLPPFRQKINNPLQQEPVSSDPNRHTLKGGPGTLHTYDFASDPAVAFDAEGRGFFSCIALDVNTNAAMVFVTQSPLGAQGAFFRNIGAASRSFVVAEDNNAEAIHDKEFITADTYPGSPNRDNVYVTWTVFRFGCGLIDYCESPIYGAMSTDHGFTWSTPERISGRSEQLCFFGNFFDPTADPHACNFDQGSDPVVLPNGDLVVAFNNGNTAPTNPNAQQLSVRCSPTGSSPDGTARLNCGTPVKVGDDIVLGEPQCNFGRGPEECIPGAFIRANDFPRLAVNRANGHLVAVWQDYRNAEFDIQLAQSLDGGMTWQQSVKVNPDRELDHYFPAVAAVEQADRDRVGVSYFRTERVPNENTTPPGGFAPGQPGVQQGNSDYVLAGGTPSTIPFSFKVVSVVFPPPDGIQAGFNGDYSGLTIPRGEEAHPIWSDTRNADPFAPLNGVARDEDVFTDRLTLPRGVGTPGVGQIGKE